jgi:hypothetical protein
MKPVQNRCTDLVRQLWFQHRWSVDARKMASSVPFEPLKNDPRGKATSNSGFDYIGRSQVTNHMPNSAQQPGFTIPPSTEGAPANPHPVRLKRLHHFRPQGPKLGCDLARPWDAKDLVESLIPITLDIVPAWGPAALPSLSESIPYPLPGFAWFRYKNARQARCFPQCPQSSPL